MVVEKINDVIFQTNIFERKLARKHSDITSHAR